MPSPPNEREATEANTASGASSEASVTAWAIIVPEATEDEASGLVWNAGCTGITIEKAAGDQVRLVCFFEDPDAQAQRIQGVASTLRGAASMIQVPNPDWVQRFKETFVSFDASPFRIVPEWLDRISDEDNLTIRVDPGRAFGTGTHESTKLCLQTLGAVADHLPESPLTLDLGCGTGILGIGAIKRAGARVLACDYDPLATSSAARHAHLNDVKFKVVLMDGCRGLLPERFDLVFANLMAPFLISRVLEITAMGAPGCRFILAGLLVEEEAAVRAAWPQDWLVTPSYQGDWASLLYQRP